MCNALELGSESIAILTLRVRTSMDSDPSPRALHIPFCLTPTTPVFSNHVGYIPLSDERFLLMSVFYSFSFHYKTPI